MKSYGGCVKKCFVILVGCSLFFSSSAAAQDSDVEGFVTRFYEQCLLRSPDQAGLDYWVNELLAGNVTGQDLAWNFIFSQEFANDYHDNEEYVTILYRAFFDREPDTGGYNNWLNRLDNFSSWTYVLFGFTGSQEFANLCDRFGMIAKQTESSSTSGTWEGRWWDSTDGDSGQVALNITQAGNMLSGTMDIYNTECGTVYDASFTGTIANNVIVIQGSYNCYGVVAELRYTQGVLSNNYSRLDGDYSLYTDGYYYDSGDFYLSKR
ncbi:MAG: DUF4214 domain-containing protein [Desulfobulbaceae bacterium]|nr:DUF4214 domain-containing protein [Desulfobulbaceae bacterium]